MKEIEIYSLLNKFKQFHASMSRFLSDTVAVTPSDADDFIITPKEVGRLFEYVMTEEPEIYPRFLEKEINDNWQLMFDSWWECMLISFRRKRGYRYIRPGCREYYIAKNSNIGKKYVQINDADNRPDYYWIDLKKECLNDILELIWTLKFWASCQPWQTQQGGTIEHIEPEKPTSSLPPELDTPQAREYLKKAQEAGFLDTHYKPIKGKMTKIQMKLFGAYCAVACNITEKHWKIFEDLWECKGLQRVKEEQGKDTKATEISALFPPDIVAKAKDRFNLLV